MPVGSACEIFLLLLYITFLHNAIVFDAEKIIEDILSNKDLGFNLFNIPNENLYIIKTVVPVSAQWNLTKYSKVLEIILCISVTLPVRSLSSS